MLLLSLMSGVGSVHRGLVYFRAVKNFFPMCIFEEVVPKVSFGISYCPLVEISHGCKLVPVGRGPVCLPLSESGFHESSLLLMSSFHQGLERGEGFDFGMCISAASWMRAVKNFAALLRFVWLLW